MMEEELHVVSLQSVALTREKQTVIEDEVSTYEEATNQVIKEILKKRLTSSARTIEVLRDAIARKFLHLRSSVGPLSKLNDEQLRSEFSRRFSLSVIQSRFKLEREASERESAFNERYRREFALFYELQYMKDIVKSARVEIGRHSRLAKTLRSIRDKTPYFKSGRLIYSKPILMLSNDAKALLLLTANGEEVPLVFDKRTRNDSIEILNQLLNGTKKHGRIRITWNKEGYLDIDIQLK
jgi:hypothetical protein